MGFSDLLSSKPSKPSSGEVFASAKVVMNAAKTKLHSSSSSAEDISYGKLAGAAGTLIGAASHYCKIKNKGFGKYAHKAEEYLHSYETKHSKPGTTVPPLQPSAQHASSGYGQDHPPTHTSAQVNHASSGYDQDHSPSTHTSSQVNHSQPCAPPYPAGYPPQGFADAQQGYGYGPPSTHTSSQVNHASSGYGHDHPPSTHTSSQVNHSQPFVTPYPAGYPPQLCPDAQQGYGYGPPSMHTSSQVNHSQPSAPPYPTGYPPQGYPYPAGCAPQGYPDAQQGYGYGPQGHSKPAESHVNVDNHPPAGYPPVGYPTSNPPAGYPTSGGNYN